MVTVIIPAYNSGETTINAIRSVLRQTYDDWNIVIVDDGSKDNTFQIVKDFLDSLPGLLSRKIVLYHQINKGPSAARNKGIELAKGKYIAFLDSDDEWLEDKLMVQLDYMKKDETLYLCATAFGKKRIDKKKINQYISFNELLFKNYFSTPTVLVKADIFEKYKFDENQRNCEDYKLWLEIAYEYKCIYINIILANNQSFKQDYGEAGLSSNLWAMEKGELSNYLFLYNKDKISFFKLSVCTLYSLAKYILRVYRTKFKKAIR